MGRSQRALLDAVNVVRAATLYQAVLHANPLNFVMKTSRVRHMSAE
jgi:hypothetical protein